MRLTQFIAPQTGEITEFITAPQPDGLRAIRKEQHLQVYFSATQNICNHILITINLFTQCKSAKRPSNVIWTAICPLLCSTRGSFRGTFPQLAATTVTSATMPAVRLCSVELHYDAFFPFVEDKKAPCTMT